MKKLITILSLVAISSTAFAGKLSRCENEILEAAQANIDLKAKAYKVDGLISGTIVTESLTQIKDEEKDQGKQEGSISATMRAKIHVGRYEVKVTVDHWCSVEKIKITDNGER